MTSSLRPEHAYPRLHVQARAKLAPTISPAPADDSDNESEQSDE